MVKTIGHYKTEQQVTQLGWLKRGVKRISKEEWPPSSPDLNPLDRGGQSATSATCTIVEVALRFHTFLKALRFSALRIKE